MIRISFIILFSFSLFLLQAQDFLQPRCPYKNIQGTDSRITKMAQDFTITTTDGVTRNLYSTLDSGKTVLIDLFYTTCSFCQLYSPVIEEVYLATGAGEGDVEVWGISNNLFDTNWVIDQYKENYNVTNPCAGPWGGGLQAFSRIVEGQNFYGFPTYCVICPDRNMYFDICYPPVAGCFYPLFEDCTVGLPDDNKNPQQTGIISVYPNPASTSLFINLNINKADRIKLDFYNSLGQKVFSSSFDAYAGFQTRNISIHQLQNGAYYLKIYMNNELLDNHKVLIFK